MSSSSIVTSLIERNLIRPPSFLKNNVHLEVLMGSVSYGVAGESSDWDVYGFCIPPKDMLFPHLRGEIPGFGKQVQRFEQYQQHHISDTDVGREYDITIYSIVKYFQLCMENNPNMLDSLFVPQRCILHSTRIGNMVREHRNIFLHKGCWPKFKGYSFSQLHKVRTKTADQGSKRKELIDKYGFDTKFAYNVVRLLDEVEQILTLGDLDLERNKEHLKAIRRGEVKEQEIYDYFQIKEKELQKAYAESSLPWGPDEEKIKKLLLACLEEHYGDLSSVVVQQDRSTQLLRDIHSMLEKNKGLLYG